MSQNKVQVEEEKKLTFKEEAFCREFIKDFNAAAAARRAKYSVSSAREIGSQNLAKLHIKKRIDQLIEENEMSEGEIKMRFSNIAKTDMSDYLTKTKVPFTPKVKKGLKEIIESQNEYIYQQEIFCERMGYTGEAFDKFQEGLNELRADVIKLEIELERNPKAYRIVDGETVMMEVAELDLIKVMKDKDRGPIKSIKHTKEGIQIDTYSADSALTTLAKFKGMLVDKSEVDLNANVDTVVKVGYGDSEQGT